MRKSFLKFLRHVFFCISDTTTNANKQQRQENLKVLFFPSVFITKKMKFINVHVYIFLLFLLLFPPHNKRIKKIWKGFLLYDVHNRRCDKERERERENHRNSFCQPYVRIQLNAVERGGEKKAKETILGKLIQNFFFFNSWHLKRQTLLEWWKIYAVEKLFKIFLSSLFFFFYVSRKIKHDVS